MLEAYVPIRLSRHYYDVSRLYRALGDALLADTELLAQVVKHKETFFRAAAASYETARPGTLCLVPSKELAAALRSDWRDMQEMLFGDPVTFDEILTDIHAVQDHINRAGSTEHLQG